MQLGLLMATPGTAQAFYMEELLAFVSLLVMSGGINLMRRGPLEKIVHRNLIGPEEFR